ncbi:MAG: hypothetical protein ACM678_02990, partial [Clostridiales bacterium]
RKLCAFRTVFHLVLVKVSLFNLQGARSIRGTGVILAPTLPFVNTFFHFFQIIFSEPDRDKSTH